jgi:putative transposase
VDSIESTEHEGPCHVRPKPQSSRTRSSRWCALDVRRSRSRATLSPPRRPSGRRRRRSTTSRDPVSRPAPDLVNRKFTADRPDQLWVADITHVPTRAGALYLATVTDVWSRKIVGWALDEAMPAELVARALEKACAARRPKRVIHNSDQGSQYTSALFSKRCAEHNVVQSMGTVGDCYDNVMAESFFATLEVELFGAVGVFRSHDDAQQQIFTYIEGFYNTQRPHSALGHRSPQRFEADAQKSRVIHSKAEVISLPPGPPPSLPQI